MDPTAPLSGLAKPSLDELASDAASGQDGHDNNDSGKAVSEFQLATANPELYLENAKFLTIIAGQKAKEQAARQVVDWAHPLKALYDANWQGAELDTFVYICEHIAAEGRVVEISYDCDTEVFYSTTLIPAIMQVNRRTRTYSKLFYKKLDFGNDRKFTYINWEVDTIRFTSCAALNAFLAQETAAANRAAIWALRHPATSAQVTLRLFSSTLNTRCIRLAIDVHLTSVVLQRGTAGVHFPNIKEIVGIRFDDSSDDPNKRSKLLDIDATSTTRLFTEIRDKVQANMKEICKPDTRIKIKDIAWRDAIDFPQEFLDAIEYEQGIDRQKRQEQYEADLLFAAQMQEELDLPQRKRVRKA